MKETQPMMSYEPLMMWSGEVTWKLKNKISPLLQSLWWQTWHNSGLWWGKLTHFFTWPSDQVVAEVTWQIKSLISSFPQGLWQMKLTEQWLTIRESHPWCHVTLWSRGLERSRNKLKAYYINSFTKPMITKLGGHLWWEKFSYNIMWLCDHIDKWGYVIN